MIVKNQNSYHYVDENHWQNSPWNEGEKVIDEFISKNNDVLSQLDQNLKRLEGLQKRFKFMVSEIKDITRRS